MIPDEPNDARVARVTRGEVRALLDGFPSRPALVFEREGDAVSVRVREGERVTPGEAAAVEALPALLRTAAALYAELAVAALALEAGEGTTSPPSDPVMVAHAEAGGFWSCVTTAGACAIVRTPGERDEVVAALDLSRQRARWRCHDTFGAACRPPEPSSSAQPRSTTFDLGPGVFVRARALYGDAVARSRAAAESAVQLLTGGRGRPTREAAVGHCDAGGDWLVGSHGLGSEILRGDAAAAAAIRGEHDAWVPVLDGRPLLAPLAAPPRPTPPPRVEPPSDAEVCRQEELGRRWRVATRISGPAAGWPKFIGKREALELRGSLRASGRWCLWWSCTQRGDDAPWPEVAAPTAAPDDTPSGATR